MVKNGVEFERRCPLFEVCQSQEATKGLDQNLSVSTALACWISIVSTDAKLQSESITTHSRPYFTGSGLIGS